MLRQVAENLLVPIYRIKIFSCDMSYFIFILYFCSIKNLDSKVCLS